MPYKKFLIPHTCKLKHMPGSGTFSNCAYSGDYICILFIELLIKYAGNTTAKIKLLSRRATGTGPMAQFQKEPRDLSPWLKAFPLFLNPFSAKHNFFHFLCPKSTQIQYIFIRPINEVKRRTIHKVDPQKHSIITVNFLVSFIITCIFQ